VLRRGAPAKARLRTAGGRPNRSVAFAQYTGPLSVLLLMRYGMVAEGGPTPVAAEAACGREKPRSRPPDQNAALGLRKGGGQAG
jgi:hypothetical protein